MQWLAHEWRIPADQLPKVKHNTPEELSDFVERYHISWDWLIFGDLKGLHAMMFARKGILRGHSSRQLSEKISSLRPDFRKIVADEIDRLLAEAAASEPEPE